MATKSIGIREFRESLSTYLLKSSTPIAITRHGDTVGYYIPTRKRRSEEEKAASRRSHERVQKWMADQGITEEDIVQDFQQWRKKRRK